MGARATRDVVRDIYALTAKRKRARMEGLLKELARTLYDDEEPEEQEDPAETLLGRWMVWASGVACRSEEGETLIADTDKFLAGKP